MFFTICRIVAIIVGIVGTTYLFPIAVSLRLNESEVLLPFLIPMIISWVFFAVFFFAGRKKKSYMSVRSGFAVVLLAWVSVSLFGSVPFYFSGAYLSFLDAFFESVSGFTTTGATVLSDVEILPRSINLWRCQTHWLGGMGIVALTVALLPILGVGGFQLIKNETTGPEKGKLTPKITTTAKALWFMYMGMTALLCVILKFQGMDFLDALSHAFSTLGTGGFSTRNASIAAYNSASIDFTCTVFMFLAGINFSLYYYALTGKFSEIKNNTEFKAYILICVVSIIAITLIELEHYGNFFTSLRYASFQSLTVISTTGFATYDFTCFKNASQAIIFFLFFIGGCSGSTSGGIKVIRWVILAKQMRNEFLKMIHPHGIFTIRINKRAGRKDVVFTVAAFFFAFVILILAATLFGTLFGLDLFTAFTGSVSMAGNVGPAFGLLGPSANCGFLPDAVKAFYCLVMIAGRLEFFTVLVFLSPAFWKK
ncbi:MAG: TrkH family potassium uptake protein [Treponema sp.]|nr:TrkH family potassium uptake protein [Treponema sp.]